MYKVLIVDDEEFIRTSIAQAVDWKGLGFSEVYQAENGVQALEIARQADPDLVLADIKMPFMNGLELTERLKEAAPAALVAIMTGYDDFKYAQRGIDLGVISYILKPIGVASLTQKLTEIRQELEKRTRERQYLDKMRRQLTQSLPLLRERFLSRLVCLPGQKKGWESGARFLEIPVLNGPFVVCVLEPDFSELSSEDGELYNFAIRNIVSETIGADKPVFGDFAGRIVMVLVRPEAEDETWSRSSIAQTLNIIRTNVNEFFKIAVTCAIGIDVDSWDGLHSSYTEAVSALECRYIFGKNKVYDIRDIDYHQPDFSFPFDNCSGFVEAVKIGDEDLMTAHLAKIRASLSSQSGVSPVNIKMVYIETVTNLLKLLAQVKHTQEKIWTQGFELYKAIQKLGTMEEISDSVMRFAREVSRELAALRTTSSQNLVNQIMEYVRLHYADETLSLVTAAEKAAVSPGYLSMLFKKETGQNFIDRLTKLRMEKAKELLCTSDLKTYEVAFQTGFSNSNYFSYAFKKYTGFSPSEYKNARTAARNA